MRRSSMLLSILLSLLTLTTFAGRERDFHCGNASHCVIPYDAEGNQDGTEVCYEDESKKLKIREVTWKNGKREGPARCFEKGKLSLEAGYRNDVLHGPFVEINDDSNGDRVTLMENGEETGLSFSVKDNKISSVHFCLIGDTPERDAILSCGEKDYGKYNTLLSTWKKEELARNKVAAAKEAKRLNGPQESKYSSGKIRSKWTNVNGSIHGKFQSFSENGKIKVDCNYSHGKMDGLCLEYDDEGRLDTRETWKNGKLAKEEIFFDNGNPARTSVREDNKKTCHVEYFENGKKLAEWCAFQSFSYRSYGKHDGPYLQWDETGDLSIRGNFENGKRTGTWEYFIDKEVRSELFFENGNLSKTIDYIRTPPQHRMVREYFPDGSLKNETRLEGLEGNQKHLI